MGDFNDILKYLRYTRREEEKEARSTTRPAIIIGPDFDINAPFHEKDFIYVSKEDIKNNRGYYTLMQLINTYASRLYIKRSSSGEIEYYFKRTVNENGEDVRYVKKLPFGAWMQNSSDVFKEVEINHRVYYSMELERFIYLPLKEIFLFPEQFVYDPKDIEKAPSEEYVFKFKDAKGYTGEGFDFGELDPTGYWKAQLRISEALRKVDFKKDKDAGLVHLLPKLDLNCNRTQLQYNYFEKGMNCNSVMGKPALQLKFKHFSAQLLYLNATIFYYFDELDDFEITKERQAFFDDYTSFVDDLLYTADHNTILEILYYVPTFFFKKLDKSFLWKVLDKVLENSITNVGLDIEDIVLQLLKGLAISEINFETFLLKLIEKRPEKQTRFEVLYERMNGVNFVGLVQFLYRIWNQSTFKYDITNPIFKKSNGPLLIPYKSKKFIGFYSSNKNFQFLNDNHILITEDESIWDNMSIVFGPKAKDAINLLIEEQNNYTYHYYHPLMLTDVVQDSVIPIPKVIPAFFLKANEDKSYWSNVITGIEYGVDVLTTLSGVGNIAKFRHLTKLAKVASKASKFNKAKNYANAVSKIRLAAGVIEISSGTVNGLIKLANLENSPFWKELSTLLFWLELLSLGGELTAAIKGGLRKSARKILKNRNELERLRKNVKNADEAKEFDEASNFLKEIAERGADDEFGDVTKSFFANADIVVEKVETSLAVVGQTKDYTCVANSLRMILDDFGRTLGEDYLAKAIKTVEKGKERGASIFSITDEALYNLYLDDLKTLARGGEGDVVRFLDLTEELKQGGKAIVSVRYQKFAHAIVVDKIENGKVFVRDPLPLNQGTCYAVSIDDFKELFNFKFVIIKK